MILVSAVLLVGLSWFLLQSSEPGVAHSIANLPKPAENSSSVTVVPPSDTPLVPAESSDRLDAPEATLVSEPKTTPQPVQAVQAPDSPTEESLTTQLQRILDTFHDVLQPEQAELGHNLMLVQELALRLSELVAPEEFSTILPQLSEAVPESWLPALEKLVQTHAAEEALRQSWQGQILQNVAQYEQEALAQRKAIMGTELYEVFYAPEQMFVASDDGMHGDLQEEPATPEMRELKAQQEQWLQQWREQEIGEGELRDRLAASLSQEQIDQLIVMGQQEQAWLEQLGQFLDEYRYIEQAGLTGNDELAMRQELLERHFAAEDRAAAEHFLFGVQAGGQQASGNSENTL
ncbi:MAG: hypothetical protein R3183_09285 [Oleiphilaceae bacterium]|nr:hypothetical protein [Oleiphilaceae bacterium]